MHKGFDRSSNPLLFYIFGIMITLEICAQSLQAGINAFEGGAHRIELCYQLPTGGLTPDASILRKLKKEIAIPIFVLIRSRPGDFVYTRQELKKMSDQISKSIDNGADGIVCGALSHTNTIDFKALELFIKASQGLPITFHRAIEYVYNIQESIDQLIDRGIKRILFGGKTGNAFENRKDLAKVNRYINGRMVLLAGSGIHSGNAKELIKTANLLEIHASAKYGNTKNNTVNEFDSDPEEVRKIIKVMATVNEV